MTSFHGVLVCPVCREHLSELDGSFRCPRQHTFDRAREGYLHLLPAGHGHSKLRGDSREMVQARRRFLDRGHYEPLSRAINERVNQRLSARSGGEGALTALEVGCGEGYYIGRLASTVPPAQPGSTHCFFGLDLSKEAIRLAARTYRDVCFLVNDVKHRISIVDHGVDLLLNVFAPRNAVEFERVMRPGGLLLVVIPGSDHLSELRARLPLLGIETEKRARTVERLGSGFELVAEDELVYSSEMEASEIRDLLTMTPNYWHLDGAVLADVAEWRPVAVTISILLLCFQKLGPA